MKRRFFIVVLCVQCFMSGFAQSTHNTSGSNLYRAGRISLQTSDSGKRLFLGASFGIGCSYLYDASGYTNFGLNFAYPITKRFGIGAYFQAGPSFAGYTDYNLSAGLQMTIGNYANGKGATLLSVGGGMKNSYDWGYYDAGASAEYYDADAGAFAELGGGYLLPNGLYFIGEIGLGSGSYYYKGYSYYDPQNDVHKYQEPISYRGLDFHIGVRVGYNFGRFIKCR